MGTTILPSNLEGMDARRDAEVDAVAAQVDAHTVEAVHTCPYHMSEVHNESLMFRKDHSKDNAPLAKMYTNKMKWYMNQNVCYTCSFDVKD